MRRRESRTRRLAKQRGDDDILRASTDVPGENERVTKSMKCPITLFPRAKESLGKVSSDIILTAILYEFTGESQHRLNGTDASRVLSYSVSTITVAV